MVMTPATLSRTKNWAELLETLKRLSERPGITLEKEAGIPLKKEVEEPCGSGSEPSRPSRIRTAADLLAFPEPEREAVLLLPACNWLRVPPLQDLSLHETWGR